MSEGLRGIHAVTKETFKRYSVKINIKIPTAMANSVLESYFGPTDRGQRQ